MEQLTESQKLEIVELWNKHAENQLLDRQEYETFYLYSLIAFKGYYHKFFANSELDFQETVNEFFTYKFMPQKIIRIQGFGGLLNTYKNFLIDRFKSKQASFENHSKTSLDEESPFTEKNHYETMVDPNAKDPSEINQFESLSDESINVFFDSLQDWQKAAIAYVTCIKLFSNQKPIPSSTLKTLLNMSSSYAYQFREFGINSKMTLQDYLQRTTIGNWIKTNILGNTTNDKNTILELMDVFFEKLCLFASSNYKNPKIENR